MGIARAIAVVFVVLCACVSMAHAQETRVALVIGNSNYAGVTPLPNPSRDADAVAQALREAGFSTVLAKQDLGYDGMRRALHEFAAEAERADWAVIYYAGHGLEMAGQNYLIPIDAHLKSDRDVQFEAVALDQVLASLEGARKLRLVILDACRDNPFLQQMTRTTASRSVGRGLARVEPEGGTIVAYAAKAGQIALDGNEQNSPFVRALVNRLAMPNIEIRRMFGLVHDDVLAATGRKQEPFVYGSLGGEELFFKVSPGGTQTNMTPAPAPVAADFAPVVPPPSMKDLIGECDRLAASQYDEDRPAAFGGVAFARIDAPAAVRACQAAAEAAPNNRRLLFQLGRSYDAANKYDEAKTWYEKAVGFGSSAAMTSIGYLYDQGHGVPQDYAEARSWYNKAIALGNSPAMNNIGYLYDQGHGVRRDYTQARRWYAKAAALGNSLAMTNLGFLYEKGNGVRQDYAEARRWYEKAAAIANPDAMNNLGVLYDHGNGVRQDYVVARQWYEKAAELGSSLAMNNLGFLYDQGSGVAQDYTVARQWYEKAAELGSSLAMTNLGLLYELGNGVSQDFAAARHWYENAAALGNEDAAKNLAILRKKMP